LKRKNRTKKPSLVNDQPHLSSVKNSVAIDLFTEEERKSIEREIKEMDDVSEILVFSSRTSFDGTHKSENV